MEPQRSGDLEVWRLWRHGGEVWRSGGRVGMEVWRACRHSSREVHTGKRTATVYGVAVKKTM
jgi:hypothetical protein